jgi:hypothetical protein
MADSPISAGLIFFRLLCQLPSAFIGTNPERAAVERPIGKAESDQVVMVEMADS